MTCGYLNESEKKREREMELKEGRKEGKEDEI